MSAFPWENVYSVCPRCGGDAGTLYLTAVNNGGEIEDELYFVRPHENMGNLANRQDEYVGPSCPLCGWESERAIEARRKADHIDHSVPVYDRRDMVEISEVSQVETTCETRVVTLRCGCEYMSSRAHLSKPDTGTTRCEVCGTGYVSVWHRVGWCPCDEHRHDPTKW